MPGGGRAERGLDGQGDGMTPRVEHGDCRDVLATLAADSLDACVTDPPYHLTSMVSRLSRANPSDVERNFTNTVEGQATSPYAAMARGFMGKTWDGGGVAFDPDTWRAVLRVLKPGAHLLAFGGTRTAHRMTCAIEDAGFEVRDTLCWLYGSGFPKSLDVSKAIDRAAGAVREVVRVGATRSRGMTGGTYIGGDGEPETRTITAPATPEAAAWTGWGTVLKPAHEPVDAARKPLSGDTLSPAGAALARGTSNVDACRVEGEGNKTFIRGAGTRSREQYRTGTTVGASSLTDLGRWPANVCHDGSDEVMAAFLLTFESGQRANPLSVPARLPTRSTVDTRNAARRAAEIPVPLPGSSTPQG